jgi:hypothetical protein
MTSLAGRVFNDVNELLETVVEFLNGVQPSELQLVFMTGSSEQDGL